MRRASPDARVRCKYKKAQVSTIDIISPKPKKLFDFKLVVGLSATRRLHWKYVTLPVTQQRFAG